MDRNVLRLQPQRRETVALCFKAQSLRQSPHFRGVCPQWILELVLHTCVWRRRAVIKIPECSPSPPRNIHKLNSRIADLKQSQWVDGRHVPHLTRRSARGKPIRFMGTGRQDGFKIGQVVQAIESGRWDLESFVWDDNSHGPKLEL